MADIPEETAERAQSVPATDLVKTAIAACIVACEAIDELDLLKNGKIAKFEGPWGSLPYQYLARVRAEEATMYLERYLRQVSSLGEWRVVLRVSQSDMKDEPNE